eukprot:766290-Hanusia_phi.AAC.1
MFLVQPRALRQSPHLCVQQLQGHGLELGGGAIHARPPDADGGVMPELYLDDVPLEDRRVPLRMPDARLLPRPRVVAVPHVHPVVYRLRPHLDLLHVLPGQRDPLPRLPHVLVQVELVDRLRPDVGEVHRLAGRGDGLICHLVLYLERGVEVRVPDPPVSALVHKAHDGIDVVGRQAHPQPLEASPQFRAAAGGVRGNECEGECVRGEAGKREMNKEEERGGRKGERG